MRLEFLTALLLASVSCTLLSEREEGRLPVRYHTTRMNIDGGEYGQLAGSSKSTLKIDDNTVLNFCIFAFDSGTGTLLRYGDEAGDELKGQPVCKYIEGKTSFDWCLPLDVEMDFYAVANIGILDTPSDIDELLSYPEMTFCCEQVYEINSSGIPMTGVIENQINTEENHQFVIPMKRILSRYDIEIDNSKLTSDVLESKITKIDLLNVHSRTTLFCEGMEYANSPDEVVNSFDYADEDDLAALNCDNPASISLYMLENMQTSGNNIDGGPALEWYQVKEYLEEIEGDFCTCLVIYFKQKFIDGTEEGRQSYIYLGNDCVSNFDIKRNTVKTLRVIVPNFKDDEIRIEMPYLVFADGPFYIYPGSETSVPFKYGCLKSEISVDAFTSGNGISVREIELDDGVGYVTIDCNSGIAGGSMIPLYAQVEEANAKTYVNVRDEIKDNVIVLDIGGSSESYLSYFSTYATDVWIDAQVEYWNGDEIKESTIAIPSGKASGSIAFGFADDILGITDFSLRTLSANYRYDVRVENPVELCWITINEVFEDGKLAVYQNGSGSGSIRVNLSCYDSENEEDEYEDVYLTIPLSSSGGLTYLDLDEYAEGLYCNDGIITEIITFSPERSDNIIYQVKLGDAIRYPY